MRSERSTWRDGQVHLGYEKKEQSVSSEKALARTRTCFLGPKDIFVPRGLIFQDSWFAARFRLLAIFWFGSGSPSPLGVEDSVEKGLRTLVPRSVSFPQSFRLKYLGPTHLQQTRLATDSRWSRRAAAPGDLRKTRWHPRATKDFAHHGRSR